MDTQQVRGVSRLANAALRSELALIACAVGIGFFCIHRKSAALGFGLAALGLRLLPVPRNFTFAKRSVIVTGGSRGLGLAIAEELLARGASVTILARDSDELDRARARKGFEDQWRVNAIVCDVTNQKDLTRAFENTHARFGRIDAVINNAGSIVVGPFESMEQSDFDAQIALHLNATVEATRLALPYFRDLGGGRIVNISSIGGKVPVPHMTSYCASKFALAGFSKSVAKELREDGIVVTTVYPGLMRTGSPIQAVFKGDQEKEYAWFAASDNLLGISVSPRSAARQIVTAAEEGRAELMFSAPARLGALAHDNFPELFSIVMETVARLLPHGKSQTRKTGAASRSWFESHWWSAPFRATAKRAEGTFNQTPKFDAEFNLNTR